MANENCLHGMRCPRCGSEEPFKIEVRILVQVWDDGTNTDAYGSDNEWDDTSYCECCKCVHHGTVKDFSTTHHQGA